MQCPLCSALGISHYHADKRRDYFQCAECQLVFVDPAQCLQSAEEKAVYDLHENDPADQGYRRFLSRLCDPLCARIAPASSGLDFGCGPGPTLSVMLEEQGHSMALYDVFYANDPAALGRRYDFITATEVIEHLYEPGRVLAQLVGMLKPGGWLGVMTKLVRSPEAFASWHYKQDETHVCFFSRDTFAWLAERYQMRLEFIGADVILLQKVEA